MSWRRTAPISYARYHLLDDVSTSFFPSLILLLTIVTVPLAVTGTSTPRFVYTFCSNDTGGRYTPNSLFQSNLNSLLFDVFLNSNTTCGANDVGESPGDVVHGLYYCRGDVGSDDCHTCIQAAASRVVQDCPTAKEAVIWYDACTLRYANRAFPPPEDESQWVSDQAPASSSIDEVDDSASRVGSDLFDGLVGELGDGSSDVSCSLRFYRRGRAKVKSTLRLEMSVQCSPQISESACETCLRASVRVIPSCCGWRREWVMIFRESCEVEYRFTNATDDDDDEDYDYDQDDNRDSSKRRRRRRRAREKWRILRDFGISTAGGTTSIGSSYAGFRIYRKLRKRFRKPHDCPRDIEPQPNQSDKCTQIQSPIKECSPCNRPCPPCNCPCPEFYAFEIPCQQNIQWHNLYYG